MKPIGIVVKVSVEGIITPLKFRYMDENQESKIINVDSVITREKKRIIGNEYKIIFSCKSIIDGKQFNYTIEFNMNNCKWFLKE